MSKNQSSIIDLTEIVEPGVAKKPEHKSEYSSAEDLKGSSAMVGDVNLDDLFAQLTDEEEEQPKPKPKPVHVVNPDEKLDIPGLDDMDAFLGQLEDDKPSNANIKNKSASGKSEDLDDILSSLLEDDEAGGKDIDLDAKLKTNSSSLASDDDLDDLLANISELPELNEKKPEPENKKAIKVSQPVDEFERMLDQLDMPSSGPVDKGEDVVVEAVELDSLLGSPTETTIKASEEEFEHLQQDIKQTAVIIEEIQNGYRGLQEEIERLYSLLPAPEYLQALEEKFHNFEEKFLEFNPEQIVTKLDEYADKIHDMEQKQVLAEGFTERFTSFENSLEQVGQRLETLIVPDQDKLLERLSGFEQRVGMLAEKIEDKTNIEDMSTRINNLDQAVGDFSVRMVEDEEKLLQSLNVNKDTESRLLACEQAINNCSEAVSRGAATEDLQERVLKLEQAAPDTDALVALILERMQPLIEQNAAAAAAKIIREEITELLSTME